MTASMLFSLGFIRRRGRFCEPIVDVLFRFAGQDEGSSRPYFTEPVVSPLTM